MPDVAVELRNVVKRFAGPAGEDVIAVRNVSLQIHDGEFFSLLGPSGCGKTTTLRMIAGFEMPTEGEVYIHGRPMGATAPFQRPVNTVFQSYALFPHMSVGENVGFGLEMKGVPKGEIGPRVKEALEMVRLPGFEKRQPKQLSGGQQQRIALARALINRPEVLLLDEPLGALDLKLRKEMQLELKGLQREVGITFIYVTHDQEEALTMSDRIAVMSSGQALQVGPASEIYEEPNCRFVADFIGETNFVEGTVKNVNGGTAEFEAGGLVMHTEAVPGLVRGARAVLAVRPERIRLSTARPDDTPNAYLGKVVESVYVGTDTRYLIDLAPAVTVRVRQQNVAPVSTATLEGTVGFEVWVSWPPDSGRVLLD
jgi:spermidine/putrescine transport system ATP-binding protein